MQRLHSGCRALKEPTSVEWRTLGWSWRNPEKRHFLTDKNHCFSSAMLAFPRPNLNRVHPIAYPELIITWDCIFMATTEGSTIILYHLLENGYRPRIAGFLVEISMKTLFIAWYSYFRLCYMCPQLVIWLFQVLGRFQPEFRQKTVIFRHFSIFSIHH